MQEKGFKWYAVRAVSGKEAKLKEYIEKECSHNEELAKHVAQVLLPMEKHAVLKNGKRVIKEKTSLPGYLFIEAELVGDTAHTLRFMPNCMGFLGGLDSPTPVRQSDINRMIGAAEETALTEEMDIPYFQGETIKVTDGPFSGFAGTIETINEEKRTLKVVVKIFGRDTPMELNFMQVEKEG